MTKCPRCGADNRPAAKFCSRCRAPLTTTPARKSAVAHLDTKPLPTQPPGDASVARRPTSPLRLPSKPRVSTMGQRGGDTRPLPAAQALFAPLPRGALLHGDEYEIASCQSEGDDLNEYVAQHRVPVRYCPAPDCGAANRADASFCEKCGRALEGVEPIQPQVLLRESAHENTFAVERWMRERGLNHEGLLIGETFAEAPYGQQKRFYLVWSEGVPTLLWTLSPPLEVDLVLTWGIQLARALDYLHRNGIVLRQVNGRHVAIAGQMARWIDFSAAQIGQPMAMPSCAEDVQGLVGMLYYLLTGQITYDPGIPVPPAAASFFASAYSPGQGYQLAADLAAALELAVAEMHRPRSVDLRVGRLTDVGQARQLNEDSLLTLDLGYVNQSLSQPLGLYVVADGMGGHSAGELASKITIDVLAQKMLAEVLLPRARGQSVMSDYTTWLREACQQANREVYERRRADRSDMGCTLVMALIDGETATIANVGDSRAYLINEREIRQITVDHSLVERLVATGQITRQEAKTHPQRNVIYRTIGDKPRVDTDVYTQPLVPGDRLLLCSDGLSGMISDEEIKQIVLTSMSPQEACRRLVDAANAAGGEDNITVIIVQVEGWSST
ncbi:MAG: Stp1/IreP family PP2C-type Ser/Thr phosphatase [Anaerolineae bacterium]|nr:Stp1/IreP family PP2C-type Ser/Thr phosphatase [Anaerolineae bacterium]